MAPSSRLLAHRFLAAWLLMAGLLFPLAARAAIGGEDTGLRLLQAQLPAGLSIQQADCEHLVRAVRMATLAHHREAPAILSAALAPGDGHSEHAAEPARACACVVRLFRTAVNAAPDHASDLLETAEALCPDCASGLAEALQRLSDKNVVADPRQPGADPTEPNPSSNTNGTGNAGNRGSAGDPGSSGDPGNPDSPSYQGLSQRNFRGIDLATPGTGSATDGAGGSPSVSGFGVGLGPGFPGAPGFSGSSPSGGIALPPSTATTTTQSTNG